MRAFRLACLAYSSVALPGSTLGLLWPSVRLSLHVPVSALGIFLAFGVVSSVLASAVTGHVLSRVSVGVFVAAGSALVGLALGVEATALSFLVFTSGSVLFSLGFGALDSALNAHAATHFGARDINWMHASYGLGATVGPLLVTAVLGAGFTWRSALGAMCVLQAGLAFVFLAARRSWPGEVREHLGADRGGQPPKGPAGSRPRRRSAAVTASALVFSAVETGIESGAGIWGYLFLTAGRGVPHSVAGVAVSAYWAMMFVGRSVLGPLAGRLGAGPVLGGAVVGVALGAAVMVLPGPGVLGVVGMMALGLAAAPIFPLFTLTTKERAGAAEEGRTTRTVALQVAASTIGSAALPAGMGLAIAAASAEVVAPSLFVLGLAMCGVYGAMSYLASGRRGEPRAGA